MRVYVTKEFSAFFFHSFIYRVTQVYTCHIFSSTKSLLFSWSHWLSY